MMSIDYLVESDLVPLVEKAVRKDGTVRVKVISPGWGSSGYYAADVLERDGPKVFKAGTKMYWDHPTKEEESQRPERSLRDLAAELTEDARWEGDSETGPGLYAIAKVFGKYREAVDELAPHIGTSIRALGKAANGEAEGRRGPVVSQLVSAKSVDFVTQPGRGGQVVQALFEAARGLNEPTLTELQGEAAVDIFTEAGRVFSAKNETELRTIAQQIIALLKQVEQTQTPPTLTPEQAAAAAAVPAIKTEAEDLAAALAAGGIVEINEVHESTPEEDVSEAELKEARTQIARLQEAGAMRDARELATRYLAGSSLPDVTKARLVEAAAGNPPINEGTLDTEKFEESLKAAVTHETAYLQQLTGYGLVRGLGESLATADGGGDTKKPTEMLESAFRSMGYDEATAKAAAAGREA